MSLPLFDAPSRPESPRARVNRRRDDVLDAVAAAAERARVRFLADAQAFVLAHLRAHGPTSGEQLSLACKAAGIVPHDDRAFGPVYMQLSRRGLITAIAHVRRERGNGTAGGNVWAANQQESPCN